MCSGVSKTWKGTRKRVGTLGWGGALMPPGSKLMDALAWSARHNKERKVFFFTQAVVCGSGDRKGQGCVPRCTVPVLFISLFFPPGPPSSWGSRSTKGLAFTQAPEPGLQSGGLLPLTNSYTTRGLFKQIADRFLSRIPACTVRLRRVLNLLLVSQATQESSWHRETHPSHQTQSPSFYGDMHK